MSANLARRLAVAAVGIPAALGIVYVGGWLLAALVAIFGVAGTWEVYRLAERHGVRPLVVPGYAAAAALPLASYPLARGGDGALSPVHVIVGLSVWLLVTLAAATVQRTPEERPLAAVGVTVFGALYAGGLPSFMIVLRHGASVSGAWGATWLVFLPLVLTWMGDTAAMAGGALIGGPKLVPVLSPKKTWAGALTGAAVSVALAPVFGRLALVPFGVRLHWWQLATLGLVVAVAGQWGDAAESLFKREASVKDSGGFFPGHGGVLDRLDSLYWAVPTAVVLLFWFGVL